MLYSGALLKQVSVPFALVRSYGFADFTRLALRMLESLRLILAMFGLCVLAMLRAYDQETVALQVLQRVVGMSGSVNTGISFDNRSLYNVRLLFNHGYPAFALAGVRYDLAGEKLRVSRSATLLVGLLSRFLWTVSGSACRE